MQSPKGLQVMYCLSVANRVSADRQSPNNIAALKRSLGERRRFLRMMFVGRAIASKASLILVCLQSLS
jgi:hypothetical protein